MGLQTLLAKTDPNANPSVLLSLPQPWIQALGALEAQSALPTPVVQKPQLQQFALPAVDPQAQFASAAMGLPAARRPSGTMRHIQHSGKFGFIAPDDGGSDIFALPPLTGFPPVGSHVVYDLVLDDKTGRPKADNISLFDATEPTAHVAPAAGSYGAVRMTVAAPRASPYAALPQPLALPQPHEAHLTGIVCAGNA